MFPNQSPKSTDQSPKFPNQSPKFPNQSPKSTDQLESEMATLVKQQYGKDKVRLVKVTDLPSSQDLKHQHVQELTVRVLLSGVQFEPSYSKADNSLVVPTDTVKNTIYYLAQKTQATLEDIEGFGKVIARHFLKKYSHVEGVHMAIVAHDWTRIQTSTLEPTTDRNAGSRVTSVNSVAALALQNHPHSFYRGGEQKRTTAIEALRVDASSSGFKIKFKIQSGIKDLYVLKSTGSSFENYHKCELTTLPPMKERIFSTDIQANWTFPPFTEAADGASKFDVIPFTNIYKSVKQVTLDLFANHDSPSVQNTLYRIGEVLLNVCPQIHDISYALPNKHVFTYDLKRFGLENKTGDKSTVYYPVADPSGLITATIGRKGASKL